VEQGTETAPRPGLAERARRRVRARVAAREAHLPPAAADPGQLPLTVIQATPTRAGSELRELWRAREMALTFAWRDVKVRYKQSLIGIGWAIIQPVTTMVVFTIIFGKFANFPAQGQQYPVFVYSGLLPWMFFATALQQISTSVVSNRNLVQKVYFPRLILPISGLLVPAVDFLFSSVVLAGLMVYWHVPVQSTVVYVPLFLLLNACTALGVGAFLATINVRYRDVPYAIPFLVQIWLYLSPVIYGSNALPDLWQWLVSFNPLVLGITGFRWALLGTPAPSHLELAAGLPTTVAFLVVGFWFYRKWEFRFADTL
jgi:lipopolysaccharide transport system permease protein